MMALRVRVTEKYVQESVTTPLSSLPAPILFLSALFPLTPCRLPASLVSFILPVFLMHHEQMLYDSSYPLFPHEGPLITLCCVYYMSYICMCIYIQVYALSFPLDILSTKRFKSTLSPVAFCDTKPLYYFPPVEFWI